MSTTSDVPTRDRILFASAELFRRQGLAATGLKQVSELAQAPFGSIYHHYPGGKEELAEAVIRAGGDFFQAIVTTAIDDPGDLVAGIRAAFDGAAETVAATDYADACPIAAIALEVASSNERLRQATAEVFEQWTTAAAERFHEAGFTATRSRELALVLLCAIEGAFVLARATRDTTALRVAGATLAATVEAELAASSQTSSG